MPVQNSWDPEIWEKKLMRLIAGQESGVTQVFNDFINASTPSLAKYKSTWKRSLWYRNRSIERELNRQLRVLHENLKNYLTVTAARGWQLAADKTDLLIADYIKNMPINEVVKEGLFNRNLDALKEFQTRRVGNMSLSERVWKIGDQTKKNIEYYLQSGLATGRSAAEISMDVRGMLKNPNKLFRRVRDPETGKLKPSRPMASYHPGQGVYRSAYQNALRMTRTETNMAYRLSDQTRWKKMDFIKGYEVRLSGSHPVYDICDEMIGHYPKSFVFGGWHPNCYCYTVPVLASENEFMGNITNDTAITGQIRSIPPAARKFVKDHTDQFVNWSSLPYWLQDNFTLKKGAFVPRANLGKVKQGTILTATKLAPRVSEAFEYIDSRVRNNVAHAMRAINKVHGDGQLPRIPLLAHARPGIGGMYKSIPMPNGELKAVHIETSYISDWKEFNIIHETGHFLDHAGIGSPRGFETEIGNLLNGFMKAARNSKTVKDLERFRDQGYRIIQGLQVPLPERDVWHVNYLLGNDEIWARAYAQYITTKSGDPRLMRQLANRNERNVFMEQWTSDDFVPLQKEIDKLFKQLGWLR